MDLDFTKCRKTQDGLVSVIDVIATVKKCDHHYAAKAYKRLLDEDRVPETPMHPHGSLARFLGGTKSPLVRGIAARNLTPVATTAQLVDIIWELQFRRNCAKVCVRYLGGDETLVDEIRANRQAQQTLRETSPSHPACLFGEAVDAESNVESDAVKRKREELQLKRLDDEIQEREYSAK